MSRILLVSASMGAGHDAAAAELGRRLEAAGHPSTRVDVLDLLPSPTGAALRAFYRTTVRRLPALYAGLYAVFFRPGGGPRPGSAPLAALAEERLLDVVRQADARAVVPVFHLAAQLAGRMRADGSLPVPSSVVVTDFAVHRQWLHPGNDLYLCLTREAAERVRQASGRPAVASGPLVARRFGESPGTGRRQWRPAVPGRPPVLVSAGAWGVGTRLAATARLLSGAGYQPVVLCGTDTRLRGRLSRTCDAVALGWVDDMPGLMASARALIDNAAGQTALEALAAGLPVIGYRPIPGHGAEGVRAMAALRLSEHAHDPWELLQALDTLTGPGPARARRVAAGRELFAAADDPVACLEWLTSRPARTAGPGRDRGR